jgi:hypothetical protein
MDTGENKSQITQMYAGSAKISVYLRHQRSDFHHALLGHDD